MTRRLHATKTLARGWRQWAQRAILKRMNAGLGRRGRFALGGTTLVLGLWAGAPWVFCSETWASEAATECTAQLTPTADARTRSPRDSAPPLAPLFL